MLGYPLTANALAWGLALGAAAALAVLAGQWTAGRLADAARFVGYPATGTRMDGMDLLALAEATGCDGVRADTPAALEKALAGLAARSRRI